MNTSIISIIAIKKDYLVQSDERLGITLILSALKGLKCTLNGLLLKFLPLKTQLFEMISI